MQAIQVCTISSQQTYIQITYQASSQGIHKLEPCPYRSLYGRTHILWANTGTFTSPHTGYPRVTGDTLRCSHMGHLNNFPNKRVHLCQTFKTRRNPCESGAGTNAAQNGNGIPMLVPFRVESPDGSFTMDASGGRGCGAFHRFEWFQLQWDITQPPAHHNKATTRDCYGGGHVSGKQKWAGLAIQASCDNMAVVQVLRSHQSMTFVLISYRIFSHPRSRHFGGIVYTQRYWKKV